MKVTGTKIGYCLGCTQVINPDEDHNCPWWQRFSQKLGSDEQGLMEGYSPIFLIGEIGSVDTSGELTFPCQADVNCVQNAIIKDLRQKKLICLAHTPFIQHIVKAEVKFELDQAESCALEAIGKGDFTFCRHGSFLAKDRFQRIINIVTGKDMRP